MFNLQESRATMKAHLPIFEDKGVVFDGYEPTAYLPPHWKRDFRLALDEARRSGFAFDAQPTLATLPNSGMPALLTTFIDPAVYEVLFAPNKAAVIFGEEKKGDWTMQTALFPLVEHVGETSSYDDYSDQGHAGANTNWDNRQAYLFQTEMIYGDLELARAGLARINWVAELQKATSTVMNKFLNFSYFFGVGNLQNYGLINDPNLGASLTPATKAYGGTRWVVNGVVQATANEIFTDIQSLFLQLVNQSGGLVDSETKMTLALSPQSNWALTTTNSFNVNVHDLLKKNFSNLTIESAVQYGAVTTQNSQGNPGGQFMQLIAQELEGQDTGYTAFNEKMRSFPIVRGTSNYRQKVSGGTWGAIIRMPVGISSMVGL